MLLQTNSYVVPKDRRAEHARLLRRFRQTLARLGCDHFEVYEQAGQNWGAGDTSGRFVQIMKFRDRRHQLAVQAGERSDPHAQQLIAEFCELINFPYQQQNGLFAVGFYNSVLPVGPARPAQHPQDEVVAGQEEVVIAEAVAAAAAAAEVAPPDQQTYVAAAQPVAEFSGEPVPPSTPAVPPPDEAVPEAHEAPADMAAAAPEAQGAVPQPATLEPAEQPEAFRDEMEALGAALDQEPMTPAAELEEAGPDPNSLDVELSHQHDQPAPPAREPEEAVGHSAAGNGELASSNGDASREHPHESDTVLADELHPPDAREDHGAFDTLLDEQFVSPANGTPDHKGGHAIESSLESTGSGIGAVLDGLDGDDLDVALPAELIEDDFEPHAPDARSKGGHANDRG